MTAEWPHDSIVSREDRILVTGATGFIGTRVVENLMQRGFRNVRCFARPSAGEDRRYRLGPAGNDARIEWITGNLLHAADCWRAAEGVSVLYHLAAGRGEKSIPDAYMNTVVATRNLLDAAVQQPSLKRFVCVSSFSVYSNGGRRPRRILDETSPVELRPERRGDAYCFAKVGQEEIVNEYRRATGVPTVVMRPGWVYGPGNEAISGRVGIGTFGLFLHLGGGNTLPLSYVDNCADAIVLGGLAPGIQGEVFNIVDDDMPSSRSFLRMYKANVRRFPSLYVPHAASYLLCYLWEKYSEWSSGQLPPVFNRTVWRAYWRPTRYSNDKIKKRVGWRQRVSTEAALNRYFAACRTGGSARPS